jgi:YesN/AraC family two-component response regulator
MPERIRVLIADDRPRSRNGLKALLVTWPEVEVVGEAVNGQEAVDLAKEHCPDVILMDALMPVMDGLEATRIIKNEWPDTKIIMLTMYASYQTNAMAAGVDDFLVKGFEAEDLLRRILDKHGSN